MSKCEKYTHFNFSLGAKKAQNAGISQEHAVKPQRDCLTLLRLQFSESRHSCLLCLGHCLQRLQECLAHSDTDIFGLTMLPIVSPPQFYQADGMLTKRMMWPFPQATFTETQRYERPPWERLRDGRVRGWMEQVTSGHRLRQWQRAEPPTPGNPLRPPVCQIHGRARTVH